MADSNGAWADFHDDELANLFDSYQPLPDRGTNIALDALLERKHLSVGSLVRVGAKLAEPTVLAFAFPGGIRYRDLTSDRRWVAPGSSWEKLKVVAAGRDRARVVLVSEGETDGARLTMLYPEADVAIMPGSKSMASRYGPSYAEQLSEYELVLVATDPDRAGDAAFAILSEHLPRVLHWPAPGGGDWCEWQPSDFGANEELEKPALPDPSAIEQPLNVIGSITFTDLGPLIRGELEPPSILVDDLLYTDGIHFLQGHPGAGKTILALHCAWLAMSEQRPVVWFDYEMGQEEVLRRLREVGVPDELTLEHFHYADWPRDPLVELTAVQERWPAALVVLDSASKSITLAGLDENAPSDVTKWLAPVVKAVKQLKFPVIVIDHVTKNATGTTRYSRGAGSKLADADVAWYVATPEGYEFNRTRSGMMHCVRQKDRRGYLPHELWWTVGDGEGGLPISPTDAPVTDVLTEGSELPSI